MANTFVSAMAKKATETRTENGAFAHNTTGSHCLDLFGTIGALRQREPQEVINLWAKAFAENPLAATKMVFYARDIRSGLGERKTSKILYHYMAENHPETLRHNIPLMAKYGRFDDLYTLVGTPLEGLMWGEFKTQLDQDVENMRLDKPISLLGKWLKSVNASSAETKALGKATAKALGMSEKAYRKTLAKLRRYSNVVEVPISANEWDNIDYEAVPSKAMTNYRCAFDRHDEYRFAEYLAAVKKGEAKINSAALYPYEIVEKYSQQQDWSARGWGRGFDPVFRIGKTDTVLEEQWKALPNYIGDENNILVMADTSGSMSGRPMMISTSLAVYFAERNHGDFHGKFMTFSERPKFVTLHGSNLMERLNQIESIVANTDLEAAMDLIVNTAVKNNIPAKDMPKALVIISDMEFDQATRGGYWEEIPQYNKDFHEFIREKFENNGYEMPKIVFWNANSRHNVFHAHETLDNVLLVSGASPTTFRVILDNINGTAEELMNETLLKYSDVVI